MILTFIQLFTTFFTIGIFTIGGGYAMLSLIQAQVVTVHSWIDEQTFTDIVAISQMTPGPIGINSATYIGYSTIQAMGGGELLSVLGSFTATAAVILPSFIIVLAIARAYDKIKENRIFKGIMDNLKPAVAGLIAAAALILTFSVKWSGIPGLSDVEISIMGENFPDWKSWVLFGGTFFASFRMKTSPILLIVIGGIIGFIIY
ncbi:MAG: chromate transporter [Bacteroidales bacterium]|nr:chromate transporter [Bacteroidales bacterium]